MGAEPESQAGPDHLTGRNGNNRSGCGLDARIEKVRYGAENFGFAQTLCYRKAETWLLEARARASIVNPWGAR
jgi:hypothetical protein